MIKKKKKLNYSFLLGFFFLAALILSFVLFLLIKSSQLVIVSKRKYSDQPRELQGNVVNSGQANSYQLFIPTELVAFNSEIVSTGLRFNAIPPKETSQHRNFDYELYKDNRLVTTYDFNPSCATYNKHNNEAWWVVEERVEGDLRKNIYKNGELYQSLKSGHLLVCPSVRKDHILVLSRDDDYLKCTIFDNNQEVQVFNCRSSFPPRLVVTESEWILYRELNPILSVLLSHGVYVREVHTLK